MLALANLSQVSHTAITNIESAQTMPGLDTTEKLARALNVNVEWLAYGIGEIRSPLMLISEAATQRVALVRVSPS